MKKTLQTLFFLSIFGIGTQLLLTSSSGGRAFAANSGNTGAPNETTTCRTCHGTGFGATVAIAVKDTNGNTVTSYIPGTIYDVDFTVSTTTGTPSSYGYQMVTLRSGNLPVNAFSSPSSNTRIVSLGNGRQYAEHNNRSSTNVFSVQWTAPASGSGTVTFYGAGAAVNNRGGTSGDGGNTTTVSLTENTAVGIEESTLNNAVQLYPNPVVDALQLQATTTDFQNPRMRIISIIGQIVREEQINLGLGQTRSVSFDGVEKGIYFLQLIEGEKMLQKKVVVK